jgi:glutathione S-transferase
VTAVSSIDHPSDSDPSAGSLLFHLALRSDWDDARRTGAYTTSTRGVSLDDEGFIHCSYAHQVEATARRFYDDLDELILLTVDPASVQARIVAEPPFPGAPERFPHVYGPIPVEAVIESRLCRRDHGEAWTLPVG